MSDSPGLNPPRSLGPAEGDVSAVIALRALLLAGQDYRAAVARHMGVSLSDTVALSYLASQGAMPVNTLAQRLDMASSSATVIVRRLEEAGLVKRSQAADRRVVMVDLTAAGNAVVSDSSRLLLDIIAGLGTSERAYAPAVLHGLANRLRDQAYELAAGRRR